MDHIDWVIYIIHFIIIYVFVKGIPIFMTNVYLYHYYINLNTSLFRVSEIYHHRIMNRTHHSQPNLTQLTTKTNLTTAVVGATNFPRSNLLFYIVQNYLCQGTNYKTFDFTIV